MTSITGFSGPISGAHGPSRGSPSRDAANPPSSFNGLLSDLQATTQGGGHAGRHAKAATGSQAATSASSPDETASSSQSTASRIALAYLQMQKGQAETPQPEEDARETPSEAEQGKPKSDGDDTTETAPATPSTSAPLDLAGLARIAAALVPTTSPVQPPAKTARQVSSATTAAAGGVLDAGAPAPDPATSADPQSAARAADPPAPTDKGGNERTRAAPTAAATDQAGGPQPATSPTDQVLAAIRSLAAAGPPQTHAPSPVPAGPQVAAAPANTGSASAPSTPEADNAKVPTRVLTIRLSPEDLGPVSITVKYRAGAMDVHIAVSNPSALHAIEADKHVLASAMEANGPGNQLSVAPAQESASASLLPDSQGQSHGQSAGTFSSASSDDRSNGNRAPRSQDPTSSTDDPKTPQPSRSLVSDGSLYL